MSSMLREVGGRDDRTQRVGYRIANMGIARPLARIRGPIAFWALAATALLASHDAVFLAQVGPGSELARVLRVAGHGYWGTASVALAVIGLAAIAGALVRLRSLRRRARALGSRPTHSDGTYVARWLGAWMRLLSVVAIGFLVQENYEHLVEHGDGPGLGALLGPEYPLALPVIALITGLGALIAASVVQTEHELLAVIAVALTRSVGRGPRNVPRPPIRLPTADRSPLALAAAGRAPPPAFASAS